MEMKMGNENENGKGKWLEMGMIINDYDTGLVWT